MKTESNLNIIWADLIVEELIRNGIDYFCVAPGSRNSPFFIALSKKKNIDPIVHFDERGLGFNALGHMSATGKPAVVITTSGTAVANLFPAVIEASKKKLPLIVLTADRPAELRWTGAHQTIDQTKIFGEYVRFFLDMPTPTTKIKLSFVLTTIDQAVFRARSGIKGPVHLNCMFREPLLGQVKNNLSTYFKEISSWRKSAECFTKYHAPQTSLSKQSTNSLVEEIDKVKSGLIVVGKLSSRRQAQAVLKLSENLGWPVFADGVSFLRFGFDNANIIHYFDLILSNLAHKKLPKVDGIIHLGGRITSKKYNEFSGQLVNCRYIMVLNHPLRNDPFHQIDIRVQSTVENFCLSICKKIKPRKASKETNRLKLLNKKVDFIVGSELQNDKPLSEASVTRLVTQNIQKKSVLFLSNSLVLRHIDRFGDYKTNPILMGANRGASGIDGVIASAVGFSEGHNQSTTLLIGDLAFLYDLNSLSMLASIKNSMQIVVLNNNGGGIFSRLDAAQIVQKETFKKYFTAPHNLDFSNIAEMFSIDYCTPKTNCEFEREYCKAQRKKKSTIIEIQTKSEENLQVENRLANKIKKMMMSLKN